MTIITDTETQNGRTGQPEPSQKGSNFSTRAGERRPGMARRGRSGSLTWLACRNSSAWWTSTHAGHRWHTGRESVEWHARRSPLALEGREGVYAAAAAAQTRRCCLYYCLRFVAGSGPRARVDAWACSTKGSALQYNGTGAGSGRAPVRECEKEWQWQVRWVRAGRSVVRYAVCVRDLFTSRGPGRGRMHASLPPSDFDFLVFVIWFGVRRQQLGLITVQYCSGLEFFLSRLGFAVHMLTALAWR
jgi:hypothetical protein